MMIFPEYSVYRTSKRNIRLILRTDGTLAVYCPKHCSKNQIEDAIKKLYPSMKEKHMIKSNAFLGTDNTLMYLGKRYPVIYNNNVGNFYFDGEHFFSPTTEIEILRCMYRDFLQEETRKLITAAVKKIAKEFSFSYGKISIKSSYSRFGSCSAKKNLNFSLALSAFEPDFIDFVASHELCHTVHLNHSKKFYSLLDAVCPRHREIQKPDSHNRSMILKSIFFNPAF